jgi:tripartite ATP-independent transporter DctP family solute receptor
MLVATSMRRRSAAFGVNSDALFVANGILVGTMLSKSASFFFIGLVVGTLLSTVGFSLFLRSAGTSKNPTAADNRITVLKLAHTLDQKHPVHQAMEFMATKLKEKSAGTIELQIFPNGQLGSETECIEQLQQGALALSKTSAAPLEGFVPEIAIFGIPYIFRDEAHYWRVIQSDMGKRLLAAGEPKGLKGLCYYDAGARSFYTVQRPILKPGDLKGLKIRVQQSKTALDMVQALGGSPTPIPFGELYTALQSNMIDGAENNTPSFYSSRHYEVCKHLSLDEHTRVPDVLMVSAKVWNELSPTVQRWLQEAADESSEFQRKLWAEEGRRLLDLIKKEGVEVHIPDQKTFAEQVKAMHQSYAGTPLGDMLLQLLSL